MPAGFASVPYEWGVSLFTTEVVDLPADVVGVLEGFVAAADRVGERGRWRRAPGAAFAEERGAEARRLLERGTCVSVRVEHDDAPAVMSHEHGLIVLIPLGGGGTHLLDISSVADDVRWDLHREGGLMRGEWRWLRLGEVGFHGFAASGDPIVPVDLGDLHGTRLEDRLTEGDDGWPGDDATLDIPFATAVDLARA